jgi:hypothetical protein
MVDDVLGVNYCSNDVVASNATVNSFMETNKLKLSSTKCSRMHIGKHGLKCPELKVHQNGMKTSVKEKYLGDVLSHDGSLDATIDDRTNKAWSYVAEIRAIMNDFPFGKRKTQVGIILREAMFINGTLYNSEAWHGVTKSHTEQLSKVDHQLLRSILSAHSKIPTEFLYLETGVLPVKYVISSRRLNYLLEIHSREDHELIKRIYMKQRQNPVRGDWAKLVDMDLELIELTEESLKNMDKISAKHEIKTRTRIAAFKELKSIQDTQEKVKDIVYTKLVSQEYLNSSIVTTKEAEIITALRSKTVRGIKSNFHTFYQGDLLCNLCKTYQDTQMHCMNCEVIISKIGDIKSHIRYEHLFGNVNEQKDVAQLYIQLLSVRDDLLLQQEEQEPGLPAAATSAGPCTYVL